MFNTESIQEKEDFYEASYTFQKFNMKPTKEKTQ